MKEVLKLQLCSTYCKNLEIQDKMSTSPEKYKL